MGTISVYAASHPCSDVYLKYCRSKSPVMPDLKKKHRIFTCAWVTIVAFIFISSGYAQIQKYTVANVHSHNDYEQRIPYWLAYNAGFGSIEADIFLVDSLLYVAHDRNELQRKIKLEEEYLLPLRQCLLKNKGYLYPIGDKKLQMLIDIKTDSINTLNALILLLKKYPELIQCKNLSWVITGNRPDERLFTGYPDFIRFDGELHKNYSEAALNKISMMSDDFRRYSFWNGEDSIKATDAAILKSAIIKSHNLNKPVRFWNAPDKPNAWRQFMVLQVDYINTDHIQELAAFLK
jgi:alkaline phosphatase